MAGFRVKYGIAFDIFFHARFSNAFLSVKWLGMCSSCIEREKWYSMGHQK